MTDLALDLERALAWTAALKTHDAMVAVITDLIAVLPLFVIPPVTRALYGQDEDGEPFLTIALSDRRASFYVDMGGISWHAIVNVEPDKLGMPGENEPVRFGAYSAGALPDILSLLFDKAPPSITFTCGKGVAQAAGAHGFLRFTNRLTAEDLQPQARLCRMAWELLDLGLEGDDNVLDCFRRNQVEFWEDTVRVFPLPGQEPA